MNTFSPVALYEVFIYLGSNTEKRVGESVLASKVS